MTILLVEDDRLLGDRVVEVFSATHPEIRVWTLATERAFREQFKKLVAFPPDLIIMDVMLPWDYPRRDRVLPPPDAVSEGFRVAGLRLYRLLQTDEALATVPIIFHSVTDAVSLRQSLGDRPAHVLILPKTGDSTEELLLYTRSLLPDQKYDAPPPRNWWHRLFDAFELKPGAFGFRVDLKKLPK